MVCPEHYMLVYFLGENSIYESLIIQLANKHGLKRIIWIDIEREYKNKSKRITVVNNISPKKFLNLIRYADLVVTDSFHGTLFSITFGRAFYVVPRKYKKYNHEPDARIKDILGRLKLSERMIRYPKDIEKVKAGIDYHEIEKILDEERKKSYLFLTNSIMN